MKYFHTTLSLLVISTLATVGWATDLKMASAMNPSETVIQLPSGIHPRVLFTSNELAQIRAKAQMPCGKTLLAHLKWNLDQPYQGAYDQLRSNKSATGKSANPVQIVNGAFNATILYLATEDTNYLNRAIDMTGFWLSLTNHPTDGRQGHKFALIYDTLYSELSDNVRTGLREYMAGRMHRTLRMLLCSRWRTPT